MDLISIARRLKRCIPTRQTAQPTENGNHDGMHMNGSSEKPSFWPGTTVPVQDDFLLWTPILHKSIYREGWRCLTKRILQDQLIWMMCRNRLILQRTCLPSLDENDGFTKPGHPYSNSKVKPYVREQTVASNPPQQTSSKSPCPPYMEACPHLGCVDTSCQPCTTKSSSNVPQQKSTKSTPSWQIPLDLYYRDLT